ncbi:uncharacterized protein BX664DRAFT_303079 [Halteromyces radiatus]|uniref:uncharacterized protein n=1 Tax=Halteromyces radiatus TaxID=101107 RepID=UPI0022208502|nr:uncharacterized protein BX664DRAFT_303079 [Halteromyces radiatus]KAI8079942.1 hypothetical protein BX664DRAFT_303079 [Halteromyces radiatus]
MSPSLPNTANGSSSSYAYRQPTNTLSPQMMKQQQQQAPYSTSRQYNYSSLGTQDIVLQQQHPSQNHPQHTSQQQNVPQVYNPIDISNMVHGSGVSGDLPATLPPLNSSILSTPNSTQGSPIRQLSQGTLAQYQQHHMQQQPQQHHQQTSQQGLDRRVQDYEQQEFAPGVSPYGCGMPGCFANFPMSSGLFYHMKSGHPNLDGIDKPYRCAMPGCSKRYKNINGLQYHLREAKGSSGHGITPPGEDVGKNYRCDAPGCKKAYRTANGLRYHQTHSHSIQPQGLTHQQQQHQQQQQQLQQQQHHHHHHHQQQLQQHHHHHHQPPRASPALLNHHYAAQSQQVLPPPPSHPSMSRHPQHAMPTIPYQPSPQQQIHHHQQQQQQQQQDQFRSRRDNNKWALDNNI